MFFKNDEENQRKMELFFAKQALDLLGEVGWVLKNCDPPEPDIRCSRDSRAFYLECTAFRAQDGAMLLAEEAWWNFVAWYHEEAQPYEVIHGKRLWLRCVGSNPTTSDIRTLQSERFLEFVKEQCERLERMRDVCEHTFGFERWEICMSSSGFSGLNPPLAHQLTSGVLQSTSRGAVAALREKSTRSYEPTGKPVYLLVHEGKYMSLNASAEYCHGDAGRQIRELLPRSPFAGVIILTGSGAEMFGDPLPWW